MARVSKQDLIQERDELLERNIELASLLDAAESRVAECEAEIEVTTNVLLNELAPRIEQAGEQLRAAHEFEEEAITLINELGDELRSANAQYHFLGQALIAIGFYEGEDAAIPVNLARSAVEEFAPDVWRQPAEEEPCDCEDCACQE